MKKVILALLVLAFSQVSLAGNSGGIMSTSFSLQGNGGGVGFSNPVWTPNGNSGGFRQFAIRILEVREEGLLVEIELNGKVQKTVLPYELLENAKLELIEALELADSKPGAWVEI